MVASQHNWGWLKCVGSESIGPVRMIELGDMVALLMKIVRSGQTRQSGAEDEDGMWRWNGHENRERSQTRRAIINRWVVVRLIRGPKT